MVVDWALGGDELRAFPGSVVPSEDLYFRPGVTWSRRTPRQGERARKSIKLGSYSAIERLVRIHPVLDKPWVPRYFVAYIVYHELLHHVIPVIQSGGRSLLHPPEFMRRERQFRHFERAAAWEHKHIDRLLRASSR
jgi:hypothetical protein